MSEKTTKSVVFNSARNTIETDNKKGGILTIKKKREDYFKDRRLRGGGRLDNRFSFVVDNWYKKMGKGG